jgi:uncharacterized RDD family membrane protein YckC
MEDEKLDRAYLDNLQKFGARNYARYSTFWARILANLVDTIVLSVGIWPVTLLHAKSGRTVGKKLMGLKLEIVSVLSNKRRRALHDFMAGTVVVKA